MKADFFRTKVFSRFIVSWHLYKQYFCQKQIGQFEEVGDILPHDVWPLYIFVSGSHGYTSVSVHEYWTLCTYVRSVYQGVQMFHNAQRNSVPPGAQPLIPTQRRISQQTPLFSISPTPTPSYISPRPAPPPQPWQTPEDTRAGHNNRSSVLPLSGSIWHCDL